MKYQTAAILLSLMTSSTFAADTPALIPLPQKMECREGAFKLQPKTRILTDVPARDTGQYLAERLVKATSYDIQNATSTGAQPAKGSIVLTTKGGQVRRPVLWGAVTAATHAAGGVRGEAGGGG